MRFKRGDLVQVVFPKTDNVLIQEAFRDWKEHLLDEQGVVFDIKIYGRHTVYHVIFNEKEVMNFFDYELEYIREASE